MALTDIDRDLWKRCLAQDPGGWREFVDRFTGLFVHVVQHTAQARSVNLTPADLEDLCSDIFLTIVADDMSVLRRFRGDSSLATYLAVIGRRIAVREITQRRFSEAMGHVRSHHTNGSSGLNRPETDRIADHDLVDQMLQGLTVREAAIVRGYHLEGRSYRELSETHGVPENTIGPTLSRAREKLRAAGLASV